MFLKIKIYFQNPNADLNFIIQFFSSLKTPLKTLFEDTIIK